MGGGSFPCIRDFLVIMSFCGVGAPGHWLFWGLACVFVFGWSGGLGASHYSAFCFLGVHPEVV